MPSLAAENKRYFCVRSNKNTGGDVKDVDAGVCNILDGNSCRFGAEGEKLEPGWREGGEPLGCNLELEVRR